MKVVIIGGGIAGLTLGIFLRKRNIESMIFERSADVGNRGHGFLMHKDGLSALAELAGTSRQFIPGRFISTFSMRWPSGQEIKQVELDAWCCMKRVDLIHFLSSLVPDEQVQYGKALSHFIYEEGRVVAAQFADGHVEYGDIFVGADGKNSRVRDLTIGPVSFSPVRVKEVVGICPADGPGVPESTFIKYQSTEIGLSLGVIPVSDTERVWFMQYDSAIADVQDSTPEELERFCRKMLKDFPEDVQRILQLNDFSTSYIWHTSDFDLLPAFHKQNVVLMGDAAHIALPFTSAGTTNAILDARALSGVLGRHAEYEDDFIHYYNSRAENLARHVNLGRELKNHFLFPRDYEGTEIKMPLIAHKEKDTLPAHGKMVDIQYFTDPICSTCWVLQPLLRKLEIEYGNYLNIEYHMGGMLESWELYQKGKIKEPLDAAKHWEEVAQLHQMPLDGDVWIDDPLDSSYPPSIAFKAAQLQDKHKARLFLRRIQEMVFIEKKNIIRWEYLEAAAIDAGLDPVRLQKDFKGEGRDRFSEDMHLGARSGVTTFPTLYFSNEGGTTVMLKGLHTYERFEEVIGQLVPYARKQHINTAPANLFTIFTTMTTKEFAFLSSCSMDEAASILDDLYDKGFADRYVSKNGTIWKGLF